MNQIDNPRCALSGEASVRPTVAARTEPLLSPPLELRTEMKWIDFSGTTNPLGTPASFIEAMKNAIASGEASYPPDREAHALRTVLARVYGLPFESFLGGTTVADLVRAVAQTYQPTTVGIAIPSPAEYALAVSNAGHSVVNVSSPAGFYILDPAIAKEHGFSFEAAVLANPGFPTSRLLPKPTLLHYLDVCKWVIVDESLIELTLGGESMVPLTKQYSNLIVVRSFSQSFALPGTPVSYCVAHPDTISQIQRFYDNAGISMFAEVLCDLAYQELGHLERARDFLEQEIPWLQCMLSLIPGIDIFPAEANFVLCRFTNEPGLHIAIKDTDELASKLQLNGYLIRKLEGFPGIEDKRYFCVAVRTRKENEKLINAMKAIILSE